MDSANSTHMRFEDTCRVCMVKNRAFLDIFRFQNRNLAEEIYFATGIPINIGDNLPPNICVACVKELSVACSFKQKCLKADQVFRQVLVEPVDYGDHFDDNQHEYNASYEVDFVKENSGIPSSSNYFQNITETKNHNLFEDIKIEKIDEFDQEINVFETAHTIKNEIQIEIKNEIQDDNLLKERVELVEQKEKKPESKEVKTKKERVRKKKNEDVQSELPFKCDFCDLKLTYKQTLIHHIHRKHLIVAKKLVCPICKQKCINTNDLEEHLKNKASIYACEVCPFKCHTRHTLWRHMRAKHMIFKTPSTMGKYCTICNTGFDSLTEFIKHEEKLHGVKEYLCSVCNQRFDNGNALENHLIEKKSVYSCDKCPSKFHHKHRYWYHMTKKHGGMPKKPRITKKICIKCNTSFDSYNEFRKHNRKMHEERHVCEVCGKHFRLSSTLWLHKRIHGTDELECDDCGYKTVHRADLKKHINIHSGTKKYTCEYCKRDFTFKHNLLAHTRRVHLKNEERKFKCTTCNKGFTTRHCLERHFVGHLGVKNFFCEHCSSSFLHYRNYRKHLKRQHNINLPKMVSGRKRTNVVEN